MNPLRVGHFVLQKLMTLKARDLLVIPFLSIIHGPALKASTFIKTLANIPNFNGSEGSHRESFRKTSFYDRRLPVVEQTTDYTCGPAVLLSIAEKRGLRNSTMTDLELGDRIGTNTLVGTSPEAMLDGLAYFGLRGKLVSQRNPELFFKTLKPKHDYLLLVWHEGYAHWVAISALDHQAVFLMDPYRSHGRLRHLPLETLIERWKAVKFDSLQVFDYLSIEIATEPGRAPTQFSEQFGMD